MIPTSIDGTDITGATIDGTDVTEITVDGDTVFTAGPDLPASTVLHLDADDYDDANNNWVANIGSDVPDGSGNPSSTTVTVSGSSFPAVRYDKSNSDASILNSTIATGDPIVLIYSVRRRTLGAFEYYLDGGGKNTFGHFESSPAERIAAIPGNLDAQGGTADTNFHVFTFDFSSSSGSLRKDGSTIATDTSVSLVDLDGLHIACRGDVVQFSDNDVLEFTVLDSPTASEISAEETRQRNKYGL